MNVTALAGFAMLAIVILIVVILVRRGRRMAAQSPQVAADPAQRQVEAGQPVPPPPVGPGAGTGAADRTNSLAILALVFGILGGYLAIIFGHLALSHIKRSGEQGRGLAIAGLILGYFWVAVTMLIVISVIVRVATGS